MHSTTRDHHSTMLATSSQALHGLIVSEKSRWIAAMPMQAATVAPTRARARTPQRTGTQQQKRRCRTSSGRNGRKACIVVGRGEGERSGEEGPARGEEAT